MKQTSFFLLLTFTLFSCSNIETQPKVLDENAKFDLEKITFDEDITQLFSKKLADEVGFEIDSINKKTFSDTIFEYKIENYLLEVLNLKLPSKKLGFLYKTIRLDSVAKIDNAYCERLWTLTDVNRKPIAYYAEARLNSKKEKDLFIKNLKTKFGKTKYEFLLVNDFNKCSFEWETLDKTIQVTTLKENSTEITTDNPLPVSKEYFTIDILLIENKFKKAIYEAHLLKLPEKLSIKGKVDTTITYNKKEVKKMLELDEINRIKDEFFLNSYYEKYVKDENGTYKIGKEN